MEEEINREGAEVEEGGEQSPVLFKTVRMQEQTQAGLLGIAYLSTVEDGAVAVEELEGIHQLALHQGAGEHRSCRPPSCANGHLPEPLLERESAAFSHHLIHAVQRLAVGGAGCGGVPES